MRQKKQNHITLDKVQKVKSQKKKKNVKVNQNVKKQWIQKEKNYHYPLKMKTINK